MNRRDYIEALLPQFDVVAWEYDWDKDAFDYVSEAGAALLGMPLDKWYEPGFWWSRIHSADREHVVPQVRQAERDRRDHYLEYRVVRADGETVWIRDATVMGDGPSRTKGLFSPQPWRDPATGTSKYVDLPRDAERDALLVATQARVDELQIVLEVFGDVYFRLSPDGVCVDSRISGACPVPVPPGGFIGCSVEEMHGPVVGAMVRDSLHQVQSTRDALTLEAELKRDGEVRNLELRILPLGSELGVVMRDVTERQERERRLARSEARLRSVLTGLPLGMHLWRAEQDEGLRLVGANPAADEVLGLDHDELLGKEMLEAFSAEHIRELRETLRRVAIEGGVYETSRIEHGNGDIEWALEIHAFQSAPREATVLFEDVSERERAVAREKAYRNRLRALAAELSSVEDKERRRLAEDLHDRVAQALAVAQIHLRQAQSDASLPGDDSNVETAMQLIDAAIKETRNLTTELFPPVLHELGLQAAIRWLCDESERLLGLRCHSEVQLRPGAGLDEHRKLVIFRAAREFLANVMKHAKATEAHVSLFHGDDYLVLSVQDNGCGFRSDWATAAAEQSFGLFSLRERLEHLGGSLEIETAPVGARVVARVPCG